MVRNLNSAIVPKKDIDTPRKDRYPGCTARATEDGAAHRDWPFGYINCYGEEDDQVAIRGQRYNTVDQEAIAQWRCRSLGDIL